MVLRKSERCWPRGCESTHSRREAFRRPGLDREVGVPALEVNDQLDLLQQSGLVKVEQAMGALLQIVRS
jgi:hypothetical protein